MAEPINELSGGPGDLPLFMRAMQNPLMENMPGIGTSVGMMHARGMNTIMRGGFMDGRKTVSKLGGFNAEGALVRPSSKAFYGTSARRAKMASAIGEEAKMPWAKGARVNHLTGRPRALSRYSSLSVMDAAEHPSFYTPFHFSKGQLGKRFAKNEGFRDLAYGGAEFEAVAGKGKAPVFQRGMISMIGAGRKTDLLERKALDKVIMKDGVSTIEKGSARAARKLAKAQINVGRLAQMNNPAMVASKSFAGGEFGRVIPKSAGLGMIAPAGETLSTTSPMAAALAGEGRVGLTGNLMASAGARPGSQAAMGYFRGALGHTEAGGLSEIALRGAQKAEQHMATAIAKSAGRDVASAADIALGKTALKEGVFKTLGSKAAGEAGVSFMGSLATKEGAMALGARTASMAIPGLNLLATASLVYDLGKMGGALVKGGLNLAKDAVKSMKGSIDKPGFGMGYKDNEVAATSRARGVAAIQNSRLNARSALGNEGSMMAAHFG